MAGTILFAFAALVIVAVAVVWMLGRLPGRSGGESLSVSGSRFYGPGRLCTAAAPVSEALRTAVRTATRRLLAAVGLAALILVAAFVVAAQYPRLLGIPLAVAPALAGAAGLLLYAVPPSPRDPDVPGTMRTASLDPRGPLSFTTRWRLGGLVTIFVGTLVLLVATGVTASDDDFGLSRQIAFGDATYSSAAGPYPGWFYAVPLIAVTLLLGVSTFIALLRIATPPSLPGPQLELEDHAWRSVVTRIVMLLSGSTALMQTGGIALFAASAVRNAGVHSGLSPLAGPISIGLLVVGLGTLVASLVGFTLTALRALDLRSAATRLTIRPATITEEAR